jgi:hypothetical protein
MVTKLIKIGIDPAQIVWLIADNETDRKLTGIGMLPTKTKDYLFLEQHQFFVGTPAALSKLNQAPLNLLHPPPLVVFVSISLRMKIRIVLIVQISSNSRLTKRAHCP